MKLAFFYDQSLLVRDSVGSVWEAIIFGLILSVVILFLFLKDWGSTPRRDRGHPGDGAGHARRDEARSA